MARNEEKAQSMLYRFREAQAAELGMHTRQDRRPRMASSCNDIRQAERWRGEILREISRKVSKIQDPGLNDYEVRDLNDQINDLFREKSHWERQIINLGGANYRRAGVATTDAEGRTIPGQRGYKYFGRAKDLPGVKELFEGAAKEQEEMDSLRKTDEAFKEFKNQGPGYFGDLDEQDGELLKAEAEEERAGWKHAFTAAATALGASPDACSIPPPPIPKCIDLAAPCNEAPAADSAEAGPAPGTKRRSGGAQPGKTKKAKGKGGATEEQAESTASGGYWTVLEVGDLKPPRAPTNQEMENMIMGLQKAALMKQYVE